MNRNKIVLICLSIIFLGIIGWNNLYSSRDESTVKEPVVKVEKEFVVTFVKENISVGNFIKSNMIQRKVIKKNEAESLGIFKDQGITINGKVIVNKNIIKGSLITRNDIVLPMDKTYALYLLNEGESIFSISAKEQNMSSSSVLIGGNVDVYLLISGLSRVNNVKNVLPKNMDNKIVKLFSHKLVVALQENNMSKTISNVDIAVSRDELEKLIIAQRTGELMVFKSIEGGNESVKDEGSITGISDIYPGINSVVEFRGEN